MAFLDGGHPSVVISDFRVPTMAAKAIADRFRRDGKKIPVFVTTTHTGGNAEVLVKRIGVSGYIAKPVNGDDVLCRVVAHAGGRGGRTSRRPSGLAI
jgi:DNA-binding response OmpR family regulator